MKRPSLRQLGLVAWRIKLHFIFLGEESARFLGRLEGGIFRSISAVVKCGIFFGQKRYTVVVYVPDEVGLLNSRGKVPSPLKPFIMKRKNRNGVDASAVDRGLLNQRAKRNASIKERDCRSITTKDQTAVRTDVEICEFGSSEVDHVPLSSKIHGTDETPAEDQKRMTDVASRGTYGRSL